MRRRGAFQRLILAEDTLMSEWFRPLFPKARSTDDSVRLYSLPTLLGDWEVHTPVKTFEIQPLRRKNDFYLIWSSEPETSREFHSVFDAIKAVAAHQTGIEQWDESTIEASDYLRHWTRRVSKRVIFNFIDLWIRHNPRGCLREMVDYFEHEDTHLVERMRIDSFLKEMIVSGQIERLPSDWLAPAELKLVVELAKDYGIPVG
jgi:hypothetical protein